MTKRHGRVFHGLMILVSLIGAIVAVLLVMLGVLCWKEAHLPPVQDYDAIVVLGAQVKADGSLSVQLNCTVVVCGGRGGNEPVPESEAMRAYLEERGIPADQIVEDDTSTSTQENLRNAAELLKGKQVQQVAIVTSDYHVPRALAMAKDQGLNATGISSPTLPEYWLKNHGRETLGWMKYLLQKYLHLPLERE